FNLSDGQVSVLPSMNTTYTMTLQPGGGTCPATVTVNPTSATYAVTDLGTLGGDTSIAYAINSIGQVVGVSQNHAFRTAANSPINPATDDLGTLGGPASIASGINSSGQVVGQSFTPSGQSHAF